MWLCEAISDGAHIIIIISVMRSCVCIYHRHNEQSTHIHVFLLAMLHESYPSWRDKVG